MTNKQLDTESLEIAIAQTEQIIARVKSAQHLVRQALDDVRRGGKIGEYEIGQTLLIAQINLTAKLLGDEE